MARHKERSAERLQDPLKRWKLPPVDRECRSRYADRGRARDAMLKATDAKHAPWSLVDFNDQRRGQLTLIRHLLDHRPDTTIAQAPIDMPPLGEPPQRKRLPDRWRTMPRWPRR